MTATVTRRRKRGADDTPVKATESAIVVTPHELTRVSPGTRAEVLAFASMSVSAGCDEVAVSIESETIYVAPMMGKDAQSEPIAQGVLDAAWCDATERPRGVRHTYHLAGRREGRDVTQARLRIAGGSDVEDSLEVPSAGVAMPRTNDALALALVRQQMQHTQGVTALMLRSHSDIIDQYRREIQRQSERIEKLENENATLRERVGQNHEIEALTEIELQRERTKAHLGAQLLRLVSHAAKQWGVMGLAPDMVVPPDVKRAIASVTDEQRAKLAAVFGPEHLGPIDQARSGADVTVGEMGAFFDLTEEQQNALFSTLRPDQIEPILKALEAGRSSAAGAGSPSGVSSHLNGSTSPK